MEQIINIINEIYNLDFANSCKNERYLHHYFTGKIQKEYPIIYKDMTNSTLHPEWTTSGKYCKTDKEYLIDENGTFGHIDFALGNYENPDLGIEFKHNQSWNFQSIVFDFMKLMDCKNKIKTAISFSIIYRKKELSNELTLEIINETITELKNRLDNRLDENRPFLFWIIEVAPQSNTNKKKSWFCNNLDNKFKEVLINKNQKQIKI